MFHLVVSTKDFSFMAPCLPNIMLHVTKISRYFPVKAVMKIQALEEMQKQL